MDKTETVRTASPARSVSECCSDLTCESGLKNNFFEGKRLTPDMFSIEQRYQVERRRLLNRAIHGWGVVYGYALQSVEAKHGPEGARRLLVGEGLALDPCGRELVQVGKESVALDELIVIDAQGRRTDLQKAIAASGRGSGNSINVRREKPCWLLSVHYAEQLADPVRISDPCTCDRHEWDHACETVRYTLREIDCDDCCHDFDCELKCDCATGPCCDDRPRREPPREVPGYPPKYPDTSRPQTGASPNVTRPTADAMADLEAAKIIGHATDAGEILEKLREAGLLERHHRAFKRGGCRCLCDHLTNLKVGGDCDLTCEIEEPCARVRVDLAHGVPLACVRLVKDECDDWTFDNELEDCGPRRLVKRNDLLFDLVRGCDLTKVGMIGWVRWHRREKPVPFDEFTAAMAPRGQDPQDTYLTRDFWLAFTGPVRQETLRPDCFAITIISTEAEGRWWHTQRVPIVGLEFMRGARDPFDLVRGARIIVDGGWLEDALHGAGSIFHAATIVEVEFRGDFVLDCNGQPIDANLLGLSGILSGNGTPGGLLLSTFPVGPKPPKQARPTTRDTYPTGAQS